MNFFFGQTHNLSVETARHEQTQWLSKTIFPDYKDCISTHVEDGFSLTLINDPKKICSYQSKSIYVDEKYVCATDCQLFNKDELAQKLGIDANTANEQFFISAFLKWGNEFPDNFDGKFSFVIWNRKNRTLLAGLDALGYGNFCHSKINDDFYFSSDLATLLDQPLVDKSVNLKRFYQSFYTANNNSPDQTYFNQCSYCPPSHIIEVTENQIETSDYWKFSEKKLSENKKDEHTNSLEFIAILRRAIEKETQDSEKIGLMLSGGYDSSLLAAILADKLEWKEKLTCYSYTFDKYKSCDESQYINKTLQQLNLEGKQINGDDKTFLSDLKTRPVTKDVINLDAYFSLPVSIYQQADEDKQNIMISGLNGGDDIFNGARYMYADLLKNRQYFTTIHKIFTANSILSEIKKLLNFGIRPILPMWIKHCYRKHFKRKESSNPFNLLPEDVNNVDKEKIITNCKLFHHQNLLKLIYFRNISEGLHFNRKYLYLNHSLQYSLPYYNKQILEFMWSLPIQFQEKKGKLRGLQINCLNIYSLNQITDRLDKTNFVELIDTGIIRNKELMKKITRSSLLIKNSIIQNNDVQKLINQTEGTSNSRTIIFFILAELWWKEIAKPNTSFNNMYKSKIAR